SYCGLSPVPMSPIAANFTVSGLFGSVSVTFGCAWTATEPSRTTSAAKRAGRGPIGLLFLQRRDRSRYEIDDQVRALIPQDQIASHEAVFQPVRETRQVHQNE